VNRLVRRRKRNHSQEMLKDSANDSKRFWKVLKKDISDKGVNFQLTKLS